MFKPNEQKPKTFLAKPMFKPNPPHQDQFCLFFRKRAYLLRTFVKRLTCIITFLAKEKGIVCDLHSAAGSNSFKRHSFTFQHFFYCFASGKDGASDKC